MKDVARPGSARRIALWQLGVATPGRRVPGGVQLALPLDLPAPPELRALTPWESMLADYGTTGLTVDAHPMALLRDRLPDGAGDEPGARDAAPRHPRCGVGGLVVARQRPGTANGIVFVLLEDEYGTINLIVPAPVYERHRLIVRTEPLITRRGQAGAPSGRRWRHQRAGRSGRADRGARSRRGRDQGLLDAGRAGAPRAGGAAGSVSRDRCRGLPRGRAAGDELRLGKAPLSRPVLRSPGERGKVPLRACRRAVRRLLGRARPRRVLPGGPRRPQRAGRLAPGRVVPGPPGAGLDARGRSTSRSAS